MTDLEKRAMPGGYRFDALTLEQLGCTENVVRGI